MDSCVEGSVNLSHEETDTLSSLNAPRNGSGEHVTSASPFGEVFRVNLGSDDFSVGASAEKTAEGLTQSNYVDDAQSDSSCEEALNGQEHRGSTEENSAEEGRRKRSAPVEETVQHGKGVNMKKGRRGGRKQGTFL